MQLPLLQAQTVFQWSRGQTEDSALSLRASQPQHTWQRQRKTSYQPQRLPYDTDSHVPSAMGCSCRRRGLTATFPPLLQASLEHTHKPLSAIKTARTPCRRSHLSRATSWGQEQPQGTGQGTGPPSPGDWLRSTRRSRAASTLVYFSLCL